MQNMILTTRITILLYFFLCHIRYLSWKSNIFSFYSNGNQLLFEDSHFYGPKYKCTTYINPFEFVLALAAMKLLCKGNK